MAKVHPNPSANTCSSSSEKETFTIWMKSLVCHGNGCTVFNSVGNVAFRVDNYQQRCSSKAFLMDSTGNILFSLNRKKLGFGSWEGFKWIDSVVRMEKPYIRVRRNGGILRKDNSCQATRKQSAEGVVLGEDVLRLTVEARADQSLVMALVTLYGLICGKL
ncbi:hypothetical protein SASPL_140786 [Salvia splendens]|uniref:Uncharacterized protein n=1 Tax=Salvia splendens TaxID=180675 RepID=A0A8X8WR00_SALSN|nr:hypothetical protein SASPL_140786 [Salvia splendens]